MGNIVIEGPSKLNGTISLQGSKNAMLINLALPLLTDEECIISNVPRIRDIELNLSIIEKLGGRVNWIDRHTVSIKCDTVGDLEIDPSDAIKTTGSKYFIPLLVRRFGKVTTGPSLGDNIGHDRGFSKFLELLESFSIGYEKCGDRHIFFSKAFGGRVSLIRLPFPSFSATVTAILSHVVGGEGAVEIQNAHLAAEIKNSVEMLRSMGAEITSEGSMIKVAGVKKLGGVHFRNMSDRNALVTYAVAALITDGDVSVTSIDDDGLEPFWEFLDRVGANYNKSKSSATFYPSLNNLKPVDIFAFMWPKFHSDWQPLVAPLLSRIHGESSITDDLWEDRFGYMKELKKMGLSYDNFNPSDSRFTDGKAHGVKIHGPSILCGSSVTALDVRGGASLVLAGLAANGKTIIGSIEQIERGYEDITGVLSSLGANIRYDA
jgi:UDP-N-acetylglucosamine 1-carboxyvinyltransferase